MVWSDEGEGQAAWAAGDDISATRKAATIHGVFIRSSPGGSGGLSVAKSSGGRFKNSRLQGHDGAAVSKTKDGTFKAIKKVYNLASTALIWLQMPANGGRLITKRSKDMGVSLVSETQQEPAC